MQSVDEQPELETVHLYVVREQKHQTSLILPPVVAVVLLSLVIVLCMLFPCREPIVRTEIRTAALFLPIVSYSASTQVQATGIKVYPAIYARGIVTIYNGSILSQEIPAGTILQTRSGTEVVIQSDVFVPAGNPPNFGIAYVKAHAALAGVQGNIAAWTINQVYGASLYMRNLSGFTGGQDAYSVKVITTQDQQVALDTARASVTQQEAHHRGYLAYPCTETMQQRNNRVRVSGACQYVTFHIPGYMHITSMRLVGKNMLIAIWYVEHRSIIVVK
jgi:hypothetical protein